MTITEFSAETAGGPLTCALASPPDPSPAPALLLTFSGARNLAVERTPYHLAAKAFTDAGHYALSFDLPQHGDRVDRHGEGIAGMCAALIGGQDPFARFVADGRAVIDACLEKGIGSEGGIFAYGISRGGYCALRLAAEDSRVRGVSGIAPVTDWRVLREFAAVTEHPEVVAAALDCRAASLARRPVFLTVGNRDARVGTPCCLRFALRLFEAEAGARESASQVRVVDSPGHGLPEEGYVAGAAFLLDLLSQKQR